MERLSCPCCYEEVEPCQYSCSCANPIMSGGCARCCSYGSYKQRADKAIILAKIIDDAFRPYLEESDRSCSTTEKAIDMKQLLCYINTSYISNLEMEVCYE